MPIDPLIPAEDPHRPALTMQAIEPSFVGEKLMRPSYPIEEDGSLASQDPQGTAAKHTIDYQPSPAPQTFFSPVQALQTDDKKSSYPSSTSQPTTQRYRNPSEGGEAPQSRPYTRTPSSYESQATSDTTSIAAAIGQQALSYIDGNQDGDYSAIPGEPGTDYPIYDELPASQFKCADQRLPGYYADVSARCQMFHVCWESRQWSFLCPNGTVFSQEHFVCVWWYEFDCSQAASLYSQNERLFKEYPGGQKSKYYKESRVLEVEPAKERNSLLLAGFATKVKADSTLDVTEQTVSDVIASIAFRTVLDEQEAATTTWIPEINIVDSTEESETSTAQSTVQ